MKFLLPMAALGMALMAAAPATAKTSVTVGARVGNVAIVVRDGGARDGQWNRGQRRGLDRAYIEQRIYRSGYIRIDDLSYSGNVYFARAVTRRGAIFALTIDAYNGNFIRVQFVGNERRRDGWRGRRW
jgi:hypothetical protein